MRCGGVGEGEGVVGRGELAEEGFVEGAGFGVEEGGGLGVAVEEEDAEGGWGGGGGGSGGHGAEGWRGGGGGMGRVVVGLERHGVWDFLRMVGARDGYVVVCKSA